MNFGRELNEEEKKQICICENCNKGGTLRHFQRCPYCGSEAYHKTIRITEYNSSDVSFEIFTQINQDETSQQNSVIL